MTKANLEILVNTFGEANIKAIHYDNARFGHSNSGDAISKIDWTNELIYDFVPTADGVGYVHLVVSDFDQVQNVEFHLDKNAIDELTLLDGADKTKITNMIAGMNAQWVNL